ncbi:hypothetical protein T05_14663 [Trichinella murrelli]|uniref:Uncharacterized protein n=1 Tax=Trichinella murrelli TaxID=144512 RepID=A0A0V0TVL0_9BILA|nr:hypothetical protein T05_14663 [Trichinella murrelli]
MCLPYGFSTGGVPRRENYIFRFTDSEWNELQYSGVLLDSFEPNILERGERRSDKQLRTITL